MIRLHKAGLPVDKIAALVDSSHLIVKATIDVYLKENDYKYTGN